VSNLGLIEGREVVSASFWPVAAGPHGVSLGLVSARDATTVTVRARREWFDRGEVARLLDFVQVSLSES
jgi:hypothetical protein